MKKSKATALLDAAIKSFADELADLLFESQMLLHTYKTVRRGEIITFDATKKVYSHTSIGDWYHGVGAEDITDTGRSLEIIAARHGNKDSIIKWFPRLLNSQIRWLLVSAFEAYERFLKELYSVMGYCDRNLWRCSDFGNNFSLMNLSSLSMADFRSIVRQSTELQPRKIRTLVAHRFGSIQRAQSKNSIAFANETITYCECVSLIELIRHIIVHENSTVSSDDFFRRLEKKWQRKVPLSHPLKTFIIHETFMYEKPNWIVWLIRDVAFAHPEADARPLGTLVQKLGTDACLLYKEVGKHFGIRPYWKRR